MGAVTILFTQSLFILVKIVITKKKLTPFILCFEHIQITAKYSCVLPFVWKDEAVLLSHWRSHPSLDTRQASASAWADGTGCPLMHEGMARYSSISLLEHSAGSVLQLS